MSKLRILHCFRAPVGGLFRHVRDLAIEQAARGHDVGVVCATASGDALTEGHLAALAPHLSLGIHRLEMPREVGAADVAAARATQRLASAMQIGVLHGHGAKGGAYARLAAAGMRRRGLESRCFYTPHGGSLHYHPSSLKGRLFMAAERYLAARTDGVIFESAYAAAVYAANVGAPACPVKVVHNGIRPDELTPVSAATDAADFVFVGELRVLKGVDVLIEAMARIRRSHDCRLVIVGAGPDAEQFQALARERGVSDHISFPGAMPARNAFSLGRTLVMPSRAESLPYIILEAAGASLPVIATRVGGIGEIVEGTDTCLIAPDIPDALAAAMIAVLDNPETARARAARLQVEVARRFSVAAMTDGILGFYEEAGDRAAGDSVPPARPLAA